MAKNKEQKPQLIDRQTLLKNRPLSPHLSIYSLQFTSGLSILHRITGAYLYLGLAIFAWLVFSFVYFPCVIEKLEEYTYYNLFTLFLFKVMLFSWTFSLFYHQLNGIRHLFWDIGKGFDLKTSYKSGITILALSIILTILCWIIVCVYPNMAELAITEIQ